MYLPRRTATQQAFADFRDCIFAVVVRRFALSGLLLVCVGLFGSPMLHSLLGHDAGYFVQQASLLGAAFSVSAIMFLMFVLWVPAHDKYIDLRTVVPAQAPYYLLRQPVLSHPRSALLTADTPPPRN